MLPRYTTRERYILHRQRHLYYVTPAEMTLTELRDHLTEAAQVVVSLPQGASWCHKRYSPKMVACCKKWLSAPPEVPTVSLKPHLFPLCTRNRTKNLCEAALFENFKLFFTVAGSEWPQR